MKILAIGDFQGKVPEKLKRKLKKEEFDLVIGVGDYAGIDDWRPWIMNNLKLSKQGKDMLSGEEYFGKKYDKLLKKDFDSGKRVLSFINKLNKKVIYVFGNGDDEWYDYKFDNVRIKESKRARNFKKKLRNMKDINYGILKYRGINFLGFGGYMDIEAFFDKKEWKEAEFDEKLKKRLKRHDKAKKKFFEFLKKLKNVDIMVLHYPPYGVFDIIKDKKGNPMNGKSAGVKFFSEGIKKYKPKLVLCGHMHEYQRIKKIGNSLVVNPGDSGDGKYAIVDYPESGEKISVRFVR